MENIIRKTFKGVCTAFAVSFALFFFGINAEAKTVSEVEPNDTRETATVIEVGDIVVGDNDYDDPDVEGSARDNFNFTISKPGKLYAKLTVKYAHCNALLIVSDFEDDMPIARYINPGENGAFDGSTPSDKVINYSEEVFFGTYAPGTYNLSLGTFGSKGYTDYTLEIIFVEEAPTQYEVEENDYEEDAYDFVWRMYSVVLGRTPDEAGLDDWTNRLESGEAQAVDIVSGFFNSDEYKNMAKSNGEIVTDCYNAMLGREPDEGGYNDWVTRLDNGMSVNAILAGFVGSQEFGNLCDSYGIQPGTYNVTEARDQNQGVTAFVARLYTQALGRGYDVDGLNDWSGQINANPSRENVLYVSTTGFLDSQEFVNKNLNNTEYVKVLYRTYLGREYDDDGLADWVGQLERGENTRDGVAAGFAYSQEFNGIMAQYGL